MWRHHQYHLKSILNSSTDTMMQSIPLGKLIFGHCKEKKSKRPKICGEKRPKIQPFLPPKRAKMFFNGLNIKFYPILTFKVLGSSTRSWDTILFIHETLKTTNVTFCFETVLNRTFYLWKNCLIDQGVQQCPFRVPYYVSNHLNPTQSRPMSIWRN